MNKNVVAIVLIIGLLFVSTVYTLTAPTGTAITSNSAFVYNYPLLKVIGAPNLFTTSPVDTSNPTASDIAQISRIRYFPAGITKGNNNKITNGGLFATDTTYYRALFYSNTIPVANTSAALVFGQYNFTSTDNQLFDYTNNFEVSRSGGLIAFSDDLRVLLYNTSALYYATQSGLTAIPPPNFVAGDCTTCNYNQVSQGTGMAADDSNVYFGNTVCNTILVWNATGSGLGIGANATRSIGQTDPKQCRTCTATSTITCLTPGIMETDCYGGLWVLNSKTILHFASGSQVASTFALSAPSTFPNSFNSVNQLAFNKKNCSYLAIATNSYQFIVQITFVNNIPTAANLITVFGSATTTPSPSNDTNSLGALSGITWDDDNLGFIWMADLANNRYIYANPFGAVVPSFSPSTSITASRTSTPSVSPTISLTASVSSTVSITSSTSISVTSTPSLTTTPTTSPSTGASQSPSVSLAVVVVSPSLSVSPSVSVSPSTTTLPASNSVSTSVVSNNNNSNSKTVSPSTLISSESSIVTMTSTNSPGATVHSDSDSDSSNNQGSLVSESASPVSGGGGGSAHTLKCWLSNVVLLL